MVAGKFYAYYCEPQIGKELAHTARFCEKVGGAINSGSERFGKGLSRIEVGFIRGRDREVIMPRVMRIGFDNGFSRYVNIDGDSDMTILEAISKELRQGGSAQGAFGLYTPDSMEG